MRVVIPSLLALSLGSAAAVANKTKFFTEEFCSTKLGSKSHSHVPSVTHTSTATIVLPPRTRTIHPTTTVTPSAKTISETATSTLTSYVTTQTTDTATLTSLVTDIETILKTELQTLTATGTVTSTLLSTITVPAAAGFTAIADATDYVPRALRYDADLYSRSNGKKKGGESISCPKKGGKPSMPGKFKYPQKVNCRDDVEEVILRTKTKTAVPKTVTAAQPTKTKTVTVTSTETGTSTLADVYLTVTETDSLTLTETSTITSILHATATLTDIIPGPTSTEYAACSSDNILTAANGGQGVLSVNIDSDVALSSADSATDCCAQCQTATSCSFYVYALGYCYLGTPTTCSAGTADGYYLTSSASVADTAIGNGPCGKLTNGISI